MIALAVALHVGLTLSVGATPAPRALARLSAVSGTTLGVAPEMRNEVLVLDLHDASISEVMPRIATVTSGAWERRGSQYVLVPDRNLRRREADDELAVRTQSVRSAIATRTVLLRKMPVFDPKSLEKKEKGERHSISVGVASNGQTPLITGVPTSGRLVTRLLTHVDPAVLARLQPGERVAFATGENAAQVAFLSDPWPDVAAATTDQNAFADWIRPKMEEASRDAGSSFEDFFGRLVETFERKVTEPPVKVILAVQRESENDVLLATARAYDRTGHAVLDANDTLSLNVSNPNPAPNQESASLSPLAREFRKLRTSLTSEAQTLAVSDDLRTRLNAPESYDPLSLDATEEVRSLVPKDRCLVACLPDAMVRPALETPRSLLAVTEEAGWTTIRPTRPAQARAERVDRDALAALVKESRTQGVPSLDAEATYAGTMWGGGNTTADALYLALFAPDLHGIEAHVRSLFSVYRALDAAARAELRGGHPLAISAPLQAATSAYLYGAGAHWSEETNIVWRSDQAPMVLDIEGFFRGYGALRNEPTEALPNGVTSEVTLSMGTEPSFYVLSSTTDGSVRMKGRVLDASFLAMQRVLSQPPFAQAVANLLSTATGGRPGPSDRLHLTFRLAPDLTQRGTLDDRQPPTSQSVGLTSLPADYERMVQKHLAALQKSPFSAFLIMGGGAKP